jgi:hypothetical protein
MTIIAERIPGTWFDRLTMTGHPELVEGCHNVCANNYVVMYKSKTVVLSAPLPSLILSRLYFGELYVSGECEFLNRALHTHRL